ncbi:MAG: hypothetical protein HY805_03725 [Nitrospirae bacterium]|nr:hypothetical protein [Nitrospirota bacterium]
MIEKQYLIMFDLDARKRHYHKTESGKITAFMVQMEIKINDMWKEVIRFDCAHNFTHKDCYNRKGEHRKVSLYIDYKEALTMADDDLNENWQYYREKFLKGDFPC